MESVLSAIESQGRQSGQARRDRKPLVRGHGHNGSASVTVTPSPKPGVTPCPALGSNRPGRFRSGASPPRLRTSQPQQAPHPQRAASLEQAALGRVAFLPEGRVERLEGDGHARESGCPIGKWEEVGHSRTPVPSSDSGIDSFDRAIRRRAIATPAALTFGGSKLRRWPELSFQPFSTRLRLSRPLPFVGRQGTEGRLARSGV
jgi:hypothetical protein